MVILRTGEAQTYTGGVHETEGHRRRERGQAADAGFLPAEGEPHVTKSACLDADVESH